MPKKKTATAKKTKAVPLPAAASVPADPWQDQVAAIITGRPAVTMRYIMQQLGVIDSPGQHYKSSMNYRNSLRLKAILRQLGRVEHKVEMKKGLGFKFIWVIPAPTPVQKKEIADAYEIEPL